MIIINSFVQTWRRQIEQDDTAQLVKISVNSVTDEDKGTYHCQLDYSTAESPLEMTVDSASDLDVYYPPSSLDMSTKMLDDGVIGIESIYRT